ncbi:hypothetical protein [Janthinobacterium sp. CAN_S7]|uniref:hypothetical protein n=1 Tax=Janthinobacterium sp. CAN_S7 TaxID=3071704 RepID=UPI00319DD2EA
MKKLQESGLFQLAVACLFLYGLFRLIESIIPSFESLPVSGIDRARQQSTATAGNELKNLYPLVSAKINKSAPAETSEVISIDDAFIPKTQITTPQTTDSAPPDYFAMLKSSGLLQLQATSNSGAIISNRYYAYGSPLTEFAYPAANGKMITPIVRQSSKRDTVDIIENPGKSHFALLMNKG